MDALSAQLSLPVHHKLDASLGTAAELCANHLKHVKEEVHLLKVEASQILLSEDDHLWLVLDQNQEIQHEFVERGHLDAEKLQGLLFETKKNVPDVLDHFLESCSVVIDKQKVKVLLDCDLGQHGGPWS